jgi:ABC-type lipoprotein release transport system permease subunit
MLYQVHALDWAVIGASLIAILLVLLLAVWWPARRASRIDPQTALRHE